jgi:hypothetical protein
MLRVATLSAVSLCLLSSCGLYRKHVEFRDLMVESRVEPKEHSQRLHLRGHIISGVLVPKRFESRIEGQTLVITLLATLATREHYNAFDVTFDIPDSVAEVRFGNRRELLWSRAHKTSSDF